MYKKDKKLTLLVWITTGLFILFEFILANGLGKNGITLMNNTRCFKYLGCNAGFFGYDALVHFTSGIFEAPLIIWLFKKYYNMSLFHDGGRKDFWKNMFILVATIALIAFGWEMLELLYDQYRMGILHQVLYIPGHLNNLVQPSNNDTMGDIFFAIVGGTFGGLIAQWTDGSIF